MTEPQKNVDGVLKRGKNDWARIEIIVTHESFQRWLLAINFLDFTASIECHEFNANIFEYGRPSASCDVNT